jgi:hypothetical protein
MVLTDPNSMDHSKIPSEECDNWKEFYPDCIEEIPYDMLVPKSGKANVTIWVDADHARDKLTRRSVTGIIVMINGTIIWTYSKCQSTVETSIYGAKLIAARIAVEFAIEARYNLQMLGVEIVGPVLLFGDNKSVIINTTLPSSPLKKKHGAINWHHVHEAIAGGIIRFVHCDSKCNLADCCTKPLDYQTMYPLLKKTLFANPEDDRSIQLKLE